MERGEGERAVGPAVLEGAVSIAAALEAHSRPVLRVLARRGPLERTAAAVLRQCAEQRVPVERVDEAALDALATGRSHGGLIAEVGERRLLPLEVLGAGEAAPFIAMLDGVEDPFNFGQAIRALYAAGAHGLVIRERAWANAAAVVARASAGASERMPTASAASAEAAAALLRARGLRVAVTDRTRAHSIYEADLTGPLFLVIGGERRGVTRSFADAADVRLMIPYGRPFALSLGTTSAAAVLAFEVMRQRMGSGINETGGL